MKNLFILSLFLLTACASQEPEQKVELKISNYGALSDIKTSLRLCEDKNYEKNFKECERVGLIYHQENKPDLAKIFFEKACNNQVGTSCYYLGTMTPVTSQLTLLESTKYLSQGCELNEYYSCYFLAKIILATVNGQPTKLPNHETYIGTIKRLLGKACDGKMNSACLILKNDLTPVKTQQAEEIKDMCRAGLIEGCELLE
jgi:uncharacterized lipoprotein YajG